jgi:cytochrome c oxidase subunit 1
MFGKMMNETLGKIHFWLSVVPITIIFCGMLLIGNAGMQRRLYNPSEYEAFRHLYPLNVWISRSAYVLFAGSALFIWNFFASLIAGKKAANNPWEVGTLEWSIPSPPPHHNYDVIPIVLHGPHEYNNPAVTGKDWLGQAEPLPGGTVVTAPTGTHQ